MDGRQIPAATVVCGTGAVLTSMTYLQTNDVSRIYVASAAILAIAAAGLNAYIPFLLVALIARFTEVINLPHQSLQINDFGPSIRRTYIGKEHSNVYGTHSWYGDTIGFWDGN